MDGCISWKHQINTHMIILAVVKPYPWFEDGWKSREAIQHKGYDSKAHIGAKNSKRCNTEEIAEELFLLDRQARIEYDGRQ